MKIATLVSSAGSQTERMIAFLNKQPNDEIFTIAELRERTQCALDGGAFAADRARWRDYTTKMVMNGRVASVWGNKKAIAQLKKEIEKESHED